MSTAITKKIQMVDLKGQYQNIKTEVDVAIQDVINSTAFINGPAVKVSGRFRAIPACKTCDTLC